MHNFYYIYQLKYIKVLSLGVYLMSGMCKALGFVPNTKDILILKFWEYVSHDQQERYEQEG